jgi:hypothetical protein
VTANDGRITLAVNGHEVSGVSKCMPRKGYLALESEGSECHFKNLRIKELPSTNPKKEEIADEAQGHRPLYFGDLTGWKADDEAKKHWLPKDTVMHYDGKGKELRTEKEYGGAEFVVDFRFPAKDGKPCTFVVRDGDSGHVRVTVSPDGKIDRTFKDVIRTQGPGARTDENSKGASAALKPGGQWNRLQIADAGGMFKVTVNGTEVKELTAAVSPRKGAFAIQPGGEMDIANVFVRESK